MVISGPKKLRSCGTITIGIIWGTSPYFLLQPLCTSDLASRHLQSSCLAFPRTQTLRYCQQTWPTGNFARLTFLPLVWKLAGSRRLTSSQMVPSIFSVSQLYIEDKTFTKLLLFTSDSDRHSWPLHRPHLWTGSHDRRTGRKHICVHGRGHLPFRGNIQTLP